MYRTQRARARALKLYAKETGLASSDSAGNEELMNDLIIPEGSLYHG
jgi:hypothetical protein